LVGDQQFGCEALLLEELCASAAAPPECIAGFGRREGFEASRGEMSDSDEPVT
jgi:hypothetical protein